MKRIIAVAATAAGLLLAGQGTLRAAGEPQCETGPNAGAAPGQQYGTAADVAAKKQMEAQKYQTTEANAASKPCEKPPSQATGASSGQKH